MTPDTRPAALQAHVRHLAAAFNVRLIESDQLKPEEALGLNHIRVALCGPVIDETTYAVALHEVGHLASPTGLLRHVVSGDTGNLQRLEETSAWEWARHYALIWTPAMESVATWAFSTYDTPHPPAHPATPTPAPANIKWDDWT